MLNHFITSNQIKYSFPNLKYEEEVLKENLDI
jgi:hypothetical protein